MKTARQESSEIPSSLADLLREAGNDALEREIASDRLRFEDPATKICLFGAGNTGREVAAMLRRKNITPVAFIDDTPHKQNTFCDGIPILSRDLAAARFGANAVVIVTIYRHGHRYLGTKSALEQAGFKSVYSFAHVVRAFPEVAGPYKCFHAPRACLLFREAIESACLSLADATSREQFERQMRFRLLLDFSAIEASAEPIYFDLTVLPSLPPEDCIYVDCGAYDGDTVLRFLTWCGGRFRSIVALEPDPVNYRKLLEAVAAQPPDVQERIRCINSAVGAAPGKAFFNAEGNQGSTLSDSGGTSVGVCRLDDVLQERGTYMIKFDVEGAEPEALKGLVRTIRDKAPVLAVSAYHRYDDLWALPLYLKSAYPDCRLYLRAYAEEGMDAVLYAVPNR